MGRKSGFRNLKSSFILSLVGVFVFWHSIAKAQFSPIPLSGGPLVKMTADYQRLTSTRYRHRHAGQPKEDCYEK